jgi:hypothetical protein
MDTWPAPLHQKITELRMERIGAFVLLAITCPM